MKYIICGLERVGLRVVEALLDLKEDVTIITLNKNEPSLFAVRNRISNYVEGDARNVETLKQAGIDEVDYILIFTSDEIKNIEINCKAKEVKPTVKTALLIRNLNYARIAEQGFEADHVFHLPSIVSFPIVSACINRTVLHTFTNHKRHYYFGLLHCSEFPFLIGKTIKEVEDTYRVKVIDYFNAGEDQKSSFSGIHLEAEGSVVFLTTDESNFRKDNFISKTREHADMTVSETAGPFDFLQRFSISAGIRKVLVLYAILIFSSVFIFERYLNLSFIDSLYFVVTTTTTVGYGDVNFLNSPVWIKVYGCFLMLAGAALLATLFSVLTDNIISKRLGRYVNFNNRNMKDHVIVAGIGSIGLGVVEYLTKLGVKTIVIEKNPDHPNIQMLRNRVPVLIGDASEQRMLMKAGIKKAKTLASLIDDDLNNINIILKGNNLNSDLHTVARIFSTGLHKKAWDAFQIDNVISAATIAVPHIISSLVSKNILWSGYIHGQIYCLFKLPVTSYLHHKSRSQIIEEFKLHPVILERRGVMMQLSDDTLINEGDHIGLFCDYESFKRIMLHR